MGLAFKSHAVSVDLLNYQNSLKRTACVVDDGRSRAVLSATAVCQILELGTCNSQKELSTETAFSQSGVEFLCTCAMCQFQ